MNLLAGDSSWQPREREGARQKDPRRDQYSSTHPPSPVPAHLITV